MGSEWRIRTAMNKVWRNLPQAASTFGPCPTEGCKGAGRGAGPCLDCVQKKLGELTDPTIAAEYVEVVRRVRQMECTVLEHFSD